MLGFTHINMAFCGRIGHHIMFEYDDFKSRFSLMMESVVLVLMPCVLVVWSLLIKALMIPNHNVITFNVVTVLS